MTPNCIELRSSIKLQDDGTLHEAALFTWYNSW